MMLQLAFITFWLLAGLAVCQIPLVVVFLAVLRRWRRYRRDDAPCPKAAVVLCLRGPDPFLADCLRAILRQDYPRYELWVVVDSQDDPAWKVAERTVSELKASNVHLAPLTVRRETCSLKCSSVVQAIGQLDASFEVVALADADTMPHPTWLRDLVAPLADPRVGATTGNRWYMPRDASWGSLVRYCWNAAAVVQMCCYHIAWGGTLAVKTEVFRRSELLERWAHAFCEDTMLKRQLASLGLKVVFVPSLMMVNRESCDMAGFFGWVRRQLLTARLYHPQWPAVVAHGLSTFLVPGFALGLAACAGLLGNWRVAAWAGGGFALYEIAMLFLLGPMEATVRRIVEARGEATRWVSLRIAVKVLGAILLTQVVYTTALISVLCLRTVHWRGVAYRIHSPWQIQLVEYRPYASSPKETAPHRSL
jgi:GT2 family glycosyltransferase